MHEKIHDLCKLAETEGIDEQRCSVRLLRSAPVSPLLRNREAAKIGVAHTQGGHASNATDLQDGKSLVE